MFGFDVDYIINKKSLYWIEPIIVQWLRVHRDYIEEFDFKDSLYWYNERGNISALAGAVWRCSGFALEEYSSEKGKDEEKSNGRIDLYFSLGENEAVVEAKLHWLYLHKAQDVNYLEVIGRAHSKAVEDIKNTMAQEPANQGLALTFILPYRKLEKNTDFQLQKLKKEILESEHDVSVWWHNETGKNLVDGNGNVFDSVAIIADLA